MPLIHLRIQSERGKIRNRKNVHLLIQSEREKTGNRKNLIQIFLYNAKSRDILPDFIDSRSFQKIILLHRDRKIYSLLFIVNAQIQ